VVSGRSEVTELLRGREQGLMSSRPSVRVVPVVRMDNDVSQRYTILDIVASNVLGLLYRISRVISRHGCNVELVLISTEGERAIDVFHISRGGAKLDAEQQHALTADLQTTLEAL
jgi:[protein-PII] uridylyltransferase